MLEKGKRIPVPFPPLDFQQGDVIPEGTRFAASSPRAKPESSLPSSPTLFKIKVGSNSEPLDSGDESDRNSNGDHIPEVRSLIYQGRSVIAKEELAVDKDKDEDGDMLQNGGDELDDGGRIFPKVPLNGGCVIDGPVPLEK